MCLRLRRTCGQRCFNREALCDVREAVLDVVGLRISFFLVSMSTLTSLWRPLEESWGIELGRRPYWHPRSWPKSGGKSNTKKPLNKQSPSIEVKTFSRLKCTTHRIGTFQSP